MIISGYKTPDLAPCFFLEHNSPSMTSSNSLNVFSLNYQKLIEFVIFFLGFFTLQTFTLDLKLIFTVR